MNVQNFRYIPISPLQAPRANCRNFCVRKLAVKPFDDIAHSKSIA